MKIAFRAVAYAAWALAFGLSVLLAVQLHQHKFSIALGIAVLALILSAFGLVMARYCWRDKDRTAATIGVVLWAAGATTFAITEFGFWYSSYKDNYAEDVQITKAKTRQEGLKDAAWETLRTGETRAGSAELEARLRGARQHEAWLTSDKCTRAQPKSRAFCQGYFELEAQLASAGKLEALETRLVGEQDATKQTVVHNVFAAADLLAENFDLSNRQAATIVVATIALMLMLSRDLLLVLASPFGGAVAARRALEAPEAIPAPPAISPRPRAPLEPRNVLAIIAGTPGSGGGGNVPDEPPPAAADSKPVADHAREVAEMMPSPPAKPVLVTEDWQPAVKPRTKAERLEAVDVITRRWLDSGAATRCAISAGSYGIHVYNSYSEWCADYHIKPVNPSHFGRSMRRLKVAFRKEAHGVRYGLRIIGKWGQIVKQQRRAA